MALFLRVLLIIAKVIKNLGLPTYPYIFLSTYSHAKLEEQINNIPQEIFRACDDANDAKNLAES